MDQTLTDTTTARLVLFAQLLDPLIYELRAWLLPLPQLRSEPRALVRDDHADVRGQECLRGPPTPPCGDAGPLAPPFTLWGHRPSSPRGNTGGRIGRNADVRRTALRPGPRSVYADADRLDLLIGAPDTTHPPALGVFSLWW
jgi:hypothetical protein